MSVNIKVDTTKFDRAMKDYMKYSSRSNVEAVNQHAYYICRNATSTTHATEASKIKQDLEAASKTNPKAPIAAILANRDLGKKGKKGLYGEKMRKAMESFIKVRVAHRNFLRSGWIPAIKILANVVPKKGGRKIPSQTDKKGRNFGGAKPAKNTSVDTKRILATIWNSALGKKNDQKSITYITEGLQQAINMEIESMGKYIQKKQQEIIERFLR